MKRSTAMLFLLLASACDKNGLLPEEPDCEKYDQGSIYVTNETGSDYKIYVNGDYVKLLMAESSVDITVKAGFNIQVNAVQASGYFLFPDKQSDKVTVTSCGQSYWTVW